jgi:IS30 family transposase
MSGPERVRAIERLAASHMGVRELSRHTGFSASTISRWLKIDRCAILKQALESELVDIGRAKVLADAPETALADLIQLAPRISRADLVQRVAAARACTANSLSRLYASVQAG